jgi:acyl-CoA reductase-like NAD-dependent aldehyde dehydrogenase
MAEQPKSINPHKETVQSLRATFKSGATRSLQWRLHQLHKIVQMMKENTKSITQALHADLRQTPFLAEMAEINLPIEEAQYHIEHLPTWIKPEKRAVDPLMKPGSGVVMREPLGVVLIISPWNYPISLMIKPLIGAISAGNCVVMKPSEISTQCSAWFAANIPKYLDSSCIRVVEGGPEDTTLLLKEQFDHIFYTGSTQVGKIIMKAAAEHLTPVTLELGGKSPCIVDSELNLDVSVRRICSGKFSNVGQTCVAPDYILVHKDVEQKFIDKLKQTIQEFYGSDPQKSADFSRIVNQRHAQRLASLIDQAQKDGDEIITGGKIDIQDRYISPTLVKTSIGAKSKLMEDEIFGPILPILTIKSIDEAIHFVNDRPKPLALYVFSSNSKTAQRVLDNTSSGGASINETVFHVACKNLPFGGVGPSGMGAYNGKDSFETFSHHKSVLTRQTWSDPSLRYPPFTDNKIWWFRTLSKIKLPKPMTLLLILLPILIAIGFHLYRSRL